VLMPRHECAQPGCRRLTTEKYCEKHTKGDNQEKTYNRARNKYDPFHVAYKKSRWMVLRKEILRDDPICRRCQLAAAVQVDHIVPARVYAADDPELFYDVSNLQGLCHPCHGQKTREDVQQYGLQCQTNRASW
jgi:5-methylcytosine-specific restriction protein A